MHSLGRLIWLGLISDMQRSFDRLIFFLQGDLPTWEVGLAAIWVSSSLPRQHNLTSNSTTFYKPCMKPCPKEHYGHHMSIPPSQ